MAKVLRVLMSLLDVMYSILVSKVEITQSEKTKLIVGLHNLQEAIDEMEKDAR